MKLLQLLSCTAYAAFAAGFFWVVDHPAEQLATFVILVVSAAVMIWRAAYARQHGLWARSLSWSVEALKPERTALVTMGVIFAVAAVGVAGNFSTPSDDKSVGVLVALFLTGGLFAALITSPHNLIELAKSEGRVDSPS
ncbi:hypothetical protein [Brevibacterium sp. FME37]|uniref:hypothetical protein n=1 Tax=Brevibacterium sp. FME37 TaxID=2742607 RepID=UPI0018688AE5|nr:hypothetical protein [Brevibacterium sp. FME37]